MSSRQRSRFNKNALDMMAAANAESSSEEESSDDIEVSKPPVKVSNFAQFVDSSSESESSSSDESDHSVPKVIVSAAAKKTNGNVNNKNKKGSLSKDLDDFDEILEADMAVETQTLKVQTIDSEEDSVIKVMNSLFHIDVNELNVDKILQQRFGVNEGNQNNAVEDIRFSSKKQEKMYNLAKKRGLLRKNKSGGSNLGTSMLRFVFGQPPASFQKPPSYIGGGYSMSKCSAPVSISSVPEWEKVFYANTQWYRIDWSADYIKLHVRYSAIQASGDVNELLMFLSQNPHQLDALIQLGMVFARTGQMDKASDLFKRCICYLECSFLSSFEPWKDVQPSFNPGNSRSPQNSLSKAFCRVDANSQENIVIFSALFRHMQISLMLGCPTVALNIALVILSLDPLRDPFYMLLFLDHLLVTSRRFDLMDLWYSNATDVNCKVCFILGTPALNEPGGSSSITNSSSSDSSLECVQENEYKPLSISDALPNWAYSHAISCFLHLEQIEKEHLFSSSSDHSADSAHKARSRANEALKNAVKRWPFLMTLLLDKVSGDPAGAELNWEKLLSHKLIKDMKSYIDSDSVLLHVAEIYVARNISLWKNKSVLKWVHSVLSNLLLKVETQRVHTVFTSENSGVSHSEGLKQHELDSLKEHYKHLSRRIEMKKYEGADIENFLEEIPRLPNDVNPLDPGLVDARYNAIFNANARNMQRNAGNVRMGQGVGAGGAALQGMNLEAMIAQLLEMQGDGEAVDIEALVAAAQNQLQQMGGEGIPLNGNNNAANMTATNIDLNAPMMQLFLQTLMPWNDVVPTEEAIEYSQGGENNEEEEDF